jgi:NADH:ubiquinone oxidoreductase subunit 6 (subunit J)
LNPFLFYFLAGVILIPALAVVFSENLFHAGLSMIVSFLGIAAVYAMLSAPFVAGIQVLVYAGAIAVLLLFAFMLTHDIMKPMEGPGRIQQGSAALACLLLAGAIGRVLMSSGWQTVNGRSETGGFPLESVGQALLTDFLVPFELVSILLLITLIGAVVIARKEERPLEAPDQDTPLEEGLS